jgi:hypothetical protein
MRKKMVMKERKDWKGDNAGTEGEKGGQIKERRNSGKGVEKHVKGGRRRSGCERGGRYGKDCMEEGRGAVL